MARTTARRMLHSILASEWAIRPEWLHQFAGVASRLEEDGNAVLTAEDIRREIRQALATLNDGDAPSAVAFNYGDPLGEETRASVRDGVAIIPVIGPLYHYADEFHDICGCSSYAQISRDVAAVRTARERGAVRAALFEVDSPGGEIGGCGETAALIAQLASEMPTAAYVSDLGCSAAYWLSVATGDVVIAPSALVGSIGVVAAFRPRGSGPALIEIVSSQSPKKRPDVETDAGRAQVLATLDALADVFVASVADYRGVDRETVLSDFGQGDVLVGARAVAVDMVDRMGSFEEILSELSQQSGQGSTLRLRPAAHAGSAPKSSDQEVEMDPKNKPAAETQPDEKKAPESAPEPAQEPDAKAIAEGERTTAERAATAERERIIGILDLPAKGFEQLRRELAADPAVTKGEAALRLLNAREEKETQARQAHLDAVKSDEEKGKPAPSADTEAGTVSAGLQRLREAEALRRPGATAPSRN